MHLSPQKIERQKKKIVISKQHGDVMPCSCHSEKMLWNPSILWATMAFDHQLSRQMLYHPIFGSLVIASPPMRGWRLHWMPSAGMIYGGSTATCWIAEIFLQMSQADSMPQLILWS